MKVVFTASALADLDEILNHAAANYPDLIHLIEQRIRASVERVGRWPESARAVEERPGVRVVPVIRYPFRIFYRVSGGQVEILQIHHAARQLPQF